MHFKNFDRIFNYCLGIRKLALNSKDLKWGGKWENSGDKSVKIWNQWCDFGGNVEKRWKENRDSVGKI